MALTTTRAIILKTYRYSDTSKILRLLTLELGPCSALARGALRPKSRFGGLLEPFVEGDATLYTKESRDLHTLSAFELEKERRELGRSLDLFTVASVICELVMRLAPEHRDDDLYRTVRAGLDGLHERASDGGAGTGLEHVWAVVDVLGFRPELDRCTACGRRIGEERVRFDFEAGGVRCRACAPSGAALEARELSDLRALVAGRPGSGRGGQGRWLADFIRYHLAEGANLRSIPFLRELA
ncbi:MAG: DNA repair protein RecO [Gemmatimonadota bacterium]|nr:DNA repair protein RecO [Gemmatimonadota bacterium]